MGDSFNRIPTKYDDFPFFLLIQYIKFSKVTFKTWKIQRKKVRERRYPAFHYKKSTVYIYIYI